MDSSQLLFYHSYFRWIVLFIMLTQGLWLWKGYKSCRIFNASDFKFLFVCTFIYNIQLVLGWSLYLNSMLVDSFWKDTAAGVKHRQIRFFGLEHMSMMTLGIVLVNIGTFRAYKGLNQKTTFKKLFKFYIWIYLIILSSIPWSFSPLTNRPNFR